MTEKDINIFPIFNQAAPGVWDDFLRIRVVSEEINYKHHLTATQLDEVTKDFQSTWRQYKHNLAFGAYDGGQMVGFIRGWASERIATVHNLFVLPQYQGQHIGRQLLQKFEHSGAIAARSMDLVALVNAMPFYEKNGYTPICPDLPNHYVKNIPHRTMACVMPVFRAVPKTINACKKLDANFDPKLINNSHVPMFAYMDPSFNVGGYAVVDGTDAPQIYLSGEFNRDWVSSRMKRELARYNEFMIATGGRTK